MTKLSDTHAILLSTASRRDGGSVLPLPDSLKPGGGTSKAIDALLKRGLIEERETGDAGAVRREDGDARYGVFITATGLEAIGVDEGDGSGQSEGAAAPSPAPIATTSKTALVLDLLRRPDGATLAELVKSTGWLPHTTRAALTGLRKKGHAIERGKRGEATCYRVASAG